MVMKDLREKFYTTKKDLWNSDAYKVFEEHSEAHREAARKFENAYKDYLNSDIYKAYNAAYKRSSSGSVAGHVEFQTMRTELVRSEIRKIYDNAIKEWGLAKREFEIARAVYESSEPYNEFLRARKDLVVRGAYEEYRDAFKKLFDDYGDNHRDKEFGACLKEFRKTSESTWNTVLLMEQDMEKISVHASMKHVSHHPQSMA
jgi:hypothetical protein